MAENGISRGMLRDAFLTVPSVMHRRGLGGGEWVQLSPPGTPGPSLTVRPALPSAHPHPYLQSQAWADFPGELGAPLKHATPHNGPVLSSPGREAGLTP